MNTIRLALFATWLFLRASALAAPAPLTVAVSDFSGEGDSARLGRELATLITADLSTQNGLTLIERGDLNRALREQSLSAAGLVSADEAARLRQIIGVKVLVTGQVIALPSDRLVVIAKIVSTENARLFAVKMEGPSSGLIDLAAKLSRQLARTIAEQAPHLVAATAEETSGVNLEPVIETLKGKNLPSVSVQFIRWGKPGGRILEAETEFGKLLLKAGFTVVDKDSDRKPDLLIFGCGQPGSMNVHDGVTTSSFSLALKAQERRTGKILAYDCQECTGHGVDENSAVQQAIVKSVGELAGRVLLPLAPRK